MSRKNSRKHQKVYKMKGCSKTRKNYLGGTSADLNLAYPSNNVATVPNPFLAYTGGSSSCSSGLTPSNLAYPQNVNGANPALPSTGPPIGGYNWINPQGNQHGGCGCGIMNGGGNKNKKAGCGPLCSLGFMAGGGHRRGCKCSACKSKMNGGSNMPYPNGLVGKPWTPAIGGWPGVDGIGGDRNYYPNNTYNNDISRQMLDIGANPPYQGVKGGRRTKKRGQRGGTLSNFLGQDLINLGRQFQYGLGSAYNALAGYPSPVNPMPWKGQLVNTANLSTIKAANI
jgi:hypothetical protein